MSITVIATRPDAIMETESNLCELKSKIPCDFQQSELFYKNAQTYWASIEPTVDGMLGGLSVINPDDIQGSKRFLNELFKMKPIPMRNRALDCGAGIGRVSKHLLLPAFNTVDIVEQQKEFTDKIQQYFSDQTQLSNRLGVVYNEGLQDFVPDKGKYDVIWCQWVLGHLRDDDFVGFFKRCANGLDENGVIVIKENVTSNHCQAYLVDEHDSSVTRPLKDLKKLLTAAGLRIIKLIEERNFIPGLLPIYIIACRPVRR